MAPERSHWGWGWADRFPSTDVRRALGQMVQAHTGVAPRDVREPVPIEAIELPAPRVTVPAQLGAFVSTERADRVRHCYGRAYLDLVRGFAGDFAASPDAVAFPADETQLEAVLAWAEAANLAVVPFGGGTSVVRGVESTREGGHVGAVSVDLRAMGRVLEVDDTSLLARIEAGAFGPDIERQLAPHGLTLRHFPQSFEHSTLGGWIATRAGGHFATVYTHIDDLVAGARMLTPRGLWQSRPLPGSGAGPSPDRLVLGSEGTLGVVTEAWMRVRPRPTYRAQANVSFARFDDAVLATRAVAQSGLFPSNARLLDAREAALNNVRSDGRHVLLLAFESADHPLDAWIERAVALALAHGGDCASGPRTRGPADARGARGDDDGRWRQAFFDGPYLQTNLVSLGVLADTFETACTWAAFPELHGALRDALVPAMQRIGGAGVLTCRFTHVYPDGPAPYYTFVTSTRPGAEAEHWLELKSLASDVLLSHGATITHHHAVGRTHRPWYARQVPDLFLRGLRAIKRELDPRGMLNPGVLIPSENS